MKDSDQSNRAQQPSDKPDYASMSTRQALLFGAKRGFRNYFEPLFIFGRFIRRCGGTNDIGVLGQCWATLTILSLPILFVYAVVISVWVLQGLSHMEPDLFKVMHGLSAAQSDRMAEFFVLAANLVVFKLRYSVVLDVESGGYRLSRRSYQR